MSHQDCLQFAEMPSQSAESAKRVALMLAAHLDNVLEILAMFAEGLDEREEGDAEILECIHEAHEPAKGALDDFFAHYEADFLAPGTGSRHRISEDDRFKRWKRQAELFK